MHTFSTTSGKLLWYEVKDNRIYLWSLDKEQQVFPIVHFTAPLTLDSSKIAKFTIEMTQQCNLRCSYCCFSGDYRNLRAHNEKEISYETLRSVVEFIKKTCRQGSIRNYCLLLWWRSFIGKKENKLDYFRA